MKIYKWIALALIVFLPVFSTGCTSTQEIEGVEVGTNFQGQGVKLFQVSVFPLYQATLEALKNMNLKVDDIQENGENYQVTVRTQDLHIIIDLLEVGLKISKMRVEAQEGGFFSTSNNEEMAREIIKETALVLEARGHFHS
ncbi:MAG: hypothetical protein NPINA01_13930 [Nitrospinaceae bacterium]|nr:MAG: hypothetical protein NPINA01_13930 [Nitrospinaceae bacterium]